MDEQTFMDSYMTCNPPSFTEFCKAQPGRTKGDGEEWQEKGVVYSTP